MTNTRPQIRKLKPPQRPQQCQRCMNPTNPESAESGKLRNWQSSRDSRSPMRIARSLYYIRGPAEVQPDEAHQRPERQLSSSEQVPARAYRLLAINMPSTPQKNKIKYGALDSRVHSGLAWRLFQARADMSVQYIEPRKTKESGAHNNDCSNI